MDLLVSFAYAAGSIVCHQLAERSFFVAGHQLPVCARCTGLYLGGVAGVSIWIAVKAARGWRWWPVNPRLASWLLVGAALPTVISYLSGVAGVWDGSNVTRAVLATPLGLTAGAVIAAVATNDLR